MTASGDILTVSIPTPGDQVAKAGQALAPMTLAAALPLVFDTNARALSTALDSLAEMGAADAEQTLIRLGLLQPGRTTLWYQRLLNRWDDLGRPALKPNATSKRVAFLSNYTIDNIAPLVTAFGAALGVHMETRLAEYDAVESEALNPESRLYQEPADFVVLGLSEHWLDRYVGTQALVAREHVDQAIRMLKRITSAVLQQSRAHVLVTAFAPHSIPKPGGYVATEGMIGRSAVMSVLNGALLSLQSDRLSVLDCPQAVHFAGGCNAYSVPNYLRAKMPYEQQMLIALAREIAFGIASLCGKSHRALVTDLDNTIWGGVIGDDGRNGIVSNQDSPDGLAYYQLQAYFKSLESLGVLLAVASKNSPEMVDVFRDNDDIALTIEDFSSTQIHWDPKSQSIGRISAELGFGAEYFVFVDDNPFELAEVLTQHPHLDVVLAQIDPMATLAQLVESRYFHTLQVTSADLQRHSQIVSKRASAQLQTKFDDYDEYLKAIHIKVKALPFGQDNRRRVVQMLQKSNQFNLTTRRHTDADIDAFIASDATIGVFSYKDDFGQQGIIAAVILVPDGDQLRIDSWVMSCRVLNRTVEQAVCRWIIGQAGNRSIVGEFIGTEKNNLVRELYHRLGFRLQSRDEEADHEWWVFEQAAGAESPRTYAQLISIVEGDSDEHS